MWQLFRETWIVSRTGALETHVVGILEAPPRGARQNNGVERGSGRGADGKKTPDSRKERTTALWMCGLGGGGGGGGLDHVDEKSLSSFVMELSEAFACAVRD